MVQTPGQTPIPQTPIQTPLPGTADNSMYNIPTGPSDYPSSGNESGVNNNEIKGGRPGPYMVKLMLRLHDSRLLVYVWSLFK